MKKDANYDRYTIITPDGLSASFIIEYGNIKFLQSTELEVWRSYPDQNRAATDIFYAKTPDGIVYEFAQKEEIEYSYSPSVMDISYVSPDYSAVSAWYLTKITNVEETDEITIEYSSGTDWIRHHTTGGCGTMTYSWQSPGGFLGCSGHGGDDKEEDDNELIYVGDPTKPGIDINPVQRVSTGPAASSGTRFYSPPLPNKITAGKNYIEFTFEGNNWIYNDANGTGDCLKTLVLYSDGNKLVKKVDFDSYYFEDGRRRLDNLTIGGDKETTEAYHFDYYASQQTSKDLFGFSNGLRSSDQSILGNYHLKLSKWRKTEIHNLKSGLLKAMISNTGMVTEFEYEPSRIALSDTSYLFGNEIIIGTRIKKITATDLCTERYRERSFTYCDPVLTADIDNLTIDAFLAPSGQCLR